jgi:hypothetical protein
MIAVKEAAMDADSMSAKPLLEIGDSLSNNVRKINMQRPKTMEI